MTSAERTLAMVKPDAVSRGLVGRIIGRIEEAGLRIVAARLLHLSEASARGFYVVHEARPFYASLCAFMSQGPVLVMVLQGDGAIQRWRDLMGATDPARAATGTLRNELGSSIEANAVHGSDSPGSAAFEIPYFFSSLEIVAPR